MRQKRRVYGREYDKGRKIIPLHYSDMCSYRDIPYAEYSDKEGLGRAIGKEIRATLCVTDEGLAGQIHKKMVEVAINGKN